MLGVKKIIMKHFINVILILIIVSCTSVKDSLIPTNNKGGYKINFFENSSTIKPKEINIYGSVVDVSNNNPINNVELTIGCYKSLTSSNGKYSFKIKGSGNTNNYVKAISIGYKTIETNFFNFHNKDSINIDLFLVEDDRPLINCEGYKR